MSWGFGIARILVLAFGLTMALAGLFLIAVEGPALSITGLWLVHIAGYRLDSDFMILSRTTFATIDAQAIE